MTRRYADATRRLKEVGLRPTRQRLSILSMLLETAPRHVTAEELFQEVRQAGIRGVARDRLQHARTSSPRPG